MGMKTVSDQLREAIGAATVTRYRIAQETGISEAALSRFVRGIRSLDLLSVDKLAAFLKLELVPMSRTRKAR